MPRTGISILLNSDYSPKDNCNFEILNSFNREDCYSNEVTYDLSILSVQVTQEKIITIPDKMQKVKSKCKREQFIKVISPSLLQVSQNSVIMINELIYSRNNQMYQENLSYYQNYIIKSAILEKSKTVQTSGNQKYDKYMRH